MADASVISNPLANINTGQVASSVLSGLYLTFFIVLIMGIIGFSCWYFFYWKKQYKYQVKLKVLQNKQFVYYQDIAKIVKDNGANFYYIKGLKERATLPPGEAMYLQPKGGWVAEGFYDRNSGVIWAKTNLSVEDFEKIINTTTPGILDGNGLPILRTVDPQFQPMTSTQRSLQAAQVTKAVLRRGKDFFSMFWQVLPFIIILMFFTITVVFWGNIIKPVETLASDLSSISKDNELILQQNLRFYTLLTGGRGNGTYIVEQVPGDSSLFNYTEGTTP